MHKREYSAGGFKLSALLVVCLLMSTGSFTKIVAQENENTKKIYDLHRKSRAQSRYNVITEKEYREKEIDLGKIYILPPKKAGTDEQNRINQARHDLLQLYRERQLIQQTLDKLEKRTLQRRRAIRQKFRRPCA